MRIHGFAALFVLAACVFQNGWAQTTTDDLEKTRVLMGQRVMSMPDFEFPANRAELDRLLDGRHFAELTAEMRKLATTPMGVNQLLSWQQYRVFTGGGYWISKQYSVTLWNVGLANARGGLPDADAFKKTAVRYGLYTMAVVNIDSARCHDRSAGPKHWDRLMRDTEDLWAYAKTMPVPEREHLVDYVWGMEVNLAPLRAKDDDLCRYGDEELAAAMAGNNLDKIKDCTQVPGLPGKTCDIHMPADYKPQYIDDIQTFLSQLQLRVALPDVFRDLLGLPKAGN